MGEGGEAFLLFSLGGEHGVVHDSLVHANGVLPVVAATSELVGILDTGLVTLAHVLLQYVEVNGTHVDHGLVDGGHTLAHFALCEVTFGRTGEAHDHGIVTFVESLQRDRKVLRGLQGYIVSAVFGRLSVLVSIDAEHGEVACVAGPHPVVRLAAEFAYARRRSCHHAHVAIDLIIEKVILVSGVERQSAYFDAGFALEVALFQFFLGQLAEELVGHGFVFVHFTGFHFSVHQVGDVYDTMHKAELQSRCGQFFGTAFGPEAVRQVVVLHAGVLLDGGISAVVVGQDEAFGRDDFTGTSSAEDADGILQRYAIGVIEVVGFQLQTLFLHHIDGILLLHQLKQPHAFVGLRREGECCGESRNKVLLDFHVCHLN